MEYPKTEAEKKKLLEEYKSAAKAQKIEKMRQAYGPGPLGCKCKHCIHLRNYQYRRTYYKCELYGTTGGAATDWKVSWLACGKFEEAVFDK